MKPDSDTFAERQLKSGHMVYVKRPDISSEWIISLVRLDQKEPLLTKEWLPEVFGWHKQTFLTPEHARTFVEDELRRLGEI
jgi:hypothetical protein